MSEPQSSLFGREHTSGIRLGNLHIIGSLIDLLALTQSDHDENEVELRQDSKNHKVENEVEVRQRSKAHNGAAEK